MNIDNKSKRMRKMLDNMPTKGEVKSKRGGKREGAGRPAIVSDTAKNRTIRLTDEQYRKFKLVGGVAWLRDILG